jgi:hypothetical protein
MYYALRALRLALEELGYPTEAEPWPVGGRQDGIT